MSDDTLYLIDAGSVSLVVALGKARLVVKSGTDITSVKLTEAEVIRMMTMLVQAGFALRGSAAPFVTNEQPEFAIGDLDSEPPTTKGQDVNRAAEWLELVSTRSVALLECKRAQRRVEYLEEGIKTLEAQKYSSAIKNNDTREALSEAAKSIVRLKGEIEELQDELRQRAELLRKLER